MTRLSAAALYLPAAFAFVLLGVAAMFAWMLRDIPLARVHSGFLAATAAATLTAQGTLAVARHRVKHDGVHILQPSGWWASGQLALFSVGVAGVLFALARSSGVGLLAASVGLLVWALVVSWHAGLVAAATRRLDTTVLQGWSPSPAEAGLESYPGKGRFLDVFKYQGVLVEQGFHVCLIEVANLPAGTGFVVGPDLVLTCNHVVVRARDGEDIRLTFHGPTPTQITEVPLASDWKVWQSDIDDLDAVLLRTKRPIAEDIVEVPSRRVGGPTDRFPRGHVDLKRAIDPRTDDTVVVFQHPHGGALKAADGSVVRLEETFFHHRADTAPGSSGSPIFESTFRPAGLHRQGYTASAKDTNKAMLLTRILPKIQAYL